MNPSVRSPASAKVLLTMLAVLASPLAIATTFSVNSTLDQPDDLTMPGTCHTAAGTCTLRAAVMQANRSNFPITILLPPGTYLLTIPRTDHFCCEADGDLDLTTPASGNPAITILGAGAASTIVDGNQLDRLFFVHPARTATISGVTIRNGKSSTASGILNQGTLTVLNSTITQNNTDPNGTGGGLYNQKIMHVRNSTISNNTAKDGAGIFTESTLFVINSTISQNNATNSGGGLYNNGPNGDTNVYNSSIVFNGADSDADATGGTGGGIFNWDGSAEPTAVNLRNTLVAGNTIQDAPVYRDCSGTVTSFGRNLFSLVPVDCTVNNAAGSSWTTLSALNTLGPLQNNGGPTSTHALLAGSNAIDGADPLNGCIDDSGVLTTDQRGYTRVAGVRCDIGAYEFGGVAPPALLSIASRKVHGAAGTFDLPLSDVFTNPTTEPRIGPAQTIVFTFDKPVDAATVTIAEGTAVLGSTNFSGNSAIVGLSSVADQQYVTVYLFNIHSVDGGIADSVFVRVGFLAGDVNQNRVVTVADLGLVNGQLAQVVTGANFLKDVNASGTLTVADKGITNADLTKALPAP